MSATRKKIFENSIKKIKQLDEWKEKINELRLDNQRLFGLIKPITATPDTYVNVKPSYRLDPNLVRKWIIIGINEDIIINEKMIKDLEDNIMGAFK